MDILLIFIIIVDLLGVVLTKKEKSLLKNLVDEETLFVILGSGILYYLELGTHTFSFPRYSKEGRVFLSIALLFNWIELYLLRKKGFSVKKQFLILLATLIIEIVLFFIISRLFSNYIVYP